MITGIAFISTVAGVSKVIAQEFTVKTETKTQPTERPKTMDAIKEAVKDLTDEQKEKLESLRQKAIAKEKALFESAGITWKMSEQRREAYASLKAKGLKGKKD
ncbi:hypothetical protein [Rubripirellula tenax]|uniref:hypothetical protein n=1 Tax=Rubripirellula tenax TaxID=2528015 RepID=UPI0011B821FB|nr:hypothetical protein [Rubripirellula tenax]